MNFTNDDWFVIKDLNNFIDYSRKLVFSMYGNKQNESEIEDIIELSQEDQTELNKLLSFDEAFGIVRSFTKKQRNKKTKEIRHMINDELYISIMQSLGDRITSNILNSLVNKGVVETAYDSEKDDFIFWIKDEKEKQ